ncbi:dihydrodipicolinate reductase [[Mycobacterium] kokjensenii]|uniref:Dihydrodipicolinate reductase n=1 Tax=[Mycobacterium] kokjensenii TaxID=3064287 RepID=A0ABM9LPK4_9MYCO|nr:dihydrodipicolinate reductase [Mycolicibacter sp. MU0083]CAJ1502576.1 dihydrodipicolinate reductase [Mycolicibacter sp. MU0083]
MAGRRYRVAQWATGTIGRYALRGVIEHPELELAGVYVYGADKVGRDAGELCGLDSTGVVATGSIEAILAAEADCVLYMPAVLDVDEVCRLLAAGVNVVTTCGQFHHPAGMDAGLRARIEQACAAGGTSIHSTGSSPGFISEALPLVLTSVQRRLTGLRIDEYADLSRRDSPEMLFGHMGFGRPAAQFEQARADYLRSSFGPSLRLVADTVGLSLDAVTATGELATAARTVQIAAGTLPAGTVAAQRIVVAGIRDGATLMSFRATWYCTTELEQDWDLAPTGWHVAVDGDAPLDVAVRMPVPLERMAEVSPAYTANRAVNLVAAVCAAAPGIRSGVDLPLAAPVLG